ncbi:MAG: tetratricopeptide repeat-containing sensor histidine kinase [Cyclobacteriaceae bacterium]
MSSKAKVLACLVLLTTHFALYGQGESELMRFQRFFHEKNQVPLEKALQTATLRLDQAMEIADPVEEAKALRNLGLIHLNRVHDYEKAMDFFIRALGMEDSLQLEPRQVLTYVAIARVFEVVGDYYKSAQFLDHALNLNEARGDINSRAMILNNLGKVNASMGRIEEAFSHYQQVLRYKEDIDKQFEAEALFNIGHLYSLQGNHAKALEGHKKALAITRDLKDPYTEALSLTDIGLVYGSMQNNEKSLANHEVALEIRQALKDKRGISESYNNIGWLYFKQKNLQEAIENGLLALENGRESQAQEQIFKSYELLSQSYKAQEDFKNALMYKELSLAINEFIQNEKQERELLETQTRYVIGKKETEIQKLEALQIDREKEIAAQKEFKNFLFLLVGLVLIIAILVFILYLVKRRSGRILEIAKNEVQQQNIKLRELNQTKDKFFSIISHDLKGPLNSLTSFSHLLIDHTDNMSKDEIQMLARDLDKSVKNLFALLENLLEWSRSQTGNIDFTGEVFNLTEILETNKNLLESQAKSKQITIAVDHQGECLVKLHKQSINTVVRNLISNAIKFTNEGGTIRVSIKKANHLLSVSVADNGIGMSEEIMRKLFRLDKKHSSKGTANEKGTGLGLILCREFIEKNGGKIRVHSEVGKGSVFTFSFPQSVSLNSAARIHQPASF